MKFIHESNAYAKLLTDGVVLAFASEKLGQMSLIEGYQRSSLKDLSRREIVLTTSNPESVYQQALNPLQRICLLLKKT